MSKKIYKDNIGIYCIQNKINKKIYIGKTSMDFSSRWKIHIRKLKTGSHHSKPLQNAFNKYGIDNFEFVILEKVPRVELIDKQYLLDLEQIYLNAYQPFQKKGYNVCSLSVGGDYKRDKNLIISSGCRRHNKNLTNKTSKYKGVYLKQKLFEAAITIDSKQTL